MKKAERINQLPPYLFAEIDKKIREALNKGVDVIKLGIGDPDMPTPKYVIDRMLTEVTLPRNHCYPPDEGLQEFREAVSRFYDRRFQVKLDSETEVVPLIGSKEGIAHISTCFVNPGDLNLVPDPGYPVYSIGTLFAGGEVYRMPLLEDNNYLPDLSKISEDAASQAKLMFLNYPNNPTGAVSTREFFQEVVEFARKNDIIVCHDGAYMDIAFEGYEPLSFLEIPGAMEVGIEFGSLSKPFNMTGWRVGYAVGSADVLEALYRYKTNIDSGNFKAVQYAGVEALDNPAAQEHISKMQQLYQERRDVVVKALQEAGWPSVKPQASFYVWAPVPKGYTSQDFVAFILDKTGVVVTPGRGFGEYGEGYFRIALTVEVERLQEAMDRIKEVVTFKT